MLLDDLSFSSSKDVDGVRMDSNIFSGLSLSVGFAVGDSMRPGRRNISCAPVEADDDLIGAGVDTRGDFGKWMGVVPPNTSVVVVPRDSGRAGSRPRGA